MKDDRTAGGRVVVITGASSGVGRAAALEFARHGARLVLVSRRQAVLDDVAAACAQRGGEAIGVVADVGDADALHRVVDRAVERFGRIDVWISNAGTGAIGEFDETPLAAHERVIRTNLLGCMNGAHAVLPQFKRQGRGILINTLSLGAWVPAPYASAYSASKFGLRGFSEALRGELHRFPTIHVCDIFPTFLDTPGFRHGANYLKRQLQPMRPLHDAREVARAMVSLALAPRDAVTIGSTAVLARAAHAVAPGVLTRLFARLVWRGSRSAPAVPRSNGTLFDSRDPGGLIDGGYRRGGERPTAAGVVAAVGVAAGLWLVWRQRQQRRQWLR